MEDTDPSLICSPTSRLYPPIQMNQWKIDRQREIDNNFQDSHPDAFTMEKIKTDINIDKSNLTPTEINSIHNLFYFYQQALNRDEFDISLGKVGETRLQTKPNSPSTLKTKPRRLPRDMMKIIYETVTSQKSMGLLESADGPFNTTLHN